MSARRESGQDLYIDPASLTHRASLDLSATGQVFDFNSPLAFTDALSTSPAHRMYNTSAAQFSIIDPVLVEQQFPNTSQPQSGSLSFSPSTSFRRPALPAALKISLPQGHGTGLPDTDPWTSIAVVAQSMTDSQQQQFADSRQAKHQQSTDSGYASSLKSNPYALSQAYMASYNTGPQHMNTESIEFRMQQDLPDQTSTLPRKTSFSKSKAPSVTSRSEVAADAEDLYCESCLTEFSTKSEYTKHMARHERKFKCDVQGCKKTDGFATHNDLDRHSRSVHHKLGPDAKVFKCFVPGCKSWEKHWPRQDNFRAHIERMHKGADVDDFTKISGEWYEQEEKPRRQAALNTNSSSQGDLEVSSQDLNTGNLQRSTGFIATPSPNGHMNSRHSIAGEFPPANLDLYSFPEITTGSGSQLMTQPSSVNRPSPLLPIPFLGLPDMERSSSNNANTSLSDMTGSANVFHQAYPSIPVIRTVDMDYHPVDAHLYPHNLPDLWDVRTMPEMGRFNSDEFPTWSPLQDLDKHDSEENTTLSQADSNMLSYMGAQDSSSLSASDTMPSQIMDLLSQAYPVATVATMPDSGDDHAEQLRQQVADAISKIHGVDPDLIEKLTKVVHEHSSSLANTDAKASSTNSRAEVQKPYECGWPNCPKRFAKKNVCAKHRKRHDRRWFCTFDECYKVFGSKQDMQRHEVTCNTQEEGWRCWCAIKSRAVNKDCTLFCTDAKTFEKHCKDDHHGYPRRSMDEFKIERDYAGQFWCGFCNAVVSNPTLGGYDGSARLKFRYDHIDKHLNENLTMAHWYDLKGEGRTKAERHLLLKEASTSFDDDDDVDEDELEISDQAAAASSSGPRRQRSETIPGPRSQYLLPPSGHTVKRPLPNGFGQGLDRAKIARVQHSQTVARRSTTPGRPAALPPTVNHSDHLVAWIGCCACRSRPRPNDGKKQCPNPECMHQVCATCKYWSRGQAPVPLIPRQS